MSASLKQNLKQSQQLLMTPQLKQAIKMLRLTRTELEEFIAEQLLENPILEEGQITSNEEKTLTQKEKESTFDEVNEAHIAQASELMDNQSEHSKDDVDWESFNRSKDNEPPIPSTAVKKNEDQPNYENFLASAETLQDYLKEQVRDLDFSEKELEIADLLVGNINDNGYLDTSLEDVHALTKGTEMEVVEGVLDTIQRMDPPGIAARDLQECLLIQIRELQVKNGVIEKIVQDHMKELESRNIPAIAKAMQMDSKVIAENVELIGDLNPNPGKRFQATATQYIVPDVFVFKMGDDWIVSLNEEGIPKLRVSQDYQKIADAQKKKNKSDNHELEYLQDKIKSAGWLIRSVQQRQKTIMRVTEAIVRKQKEFLETGLSALKPMILSDIADELELNQSTISRATSEKYVQTPRGIFELKYFFSSSVASSQGEDVTAEYVKSMIKDIVSQESATKPYSDQKIAKFLEEKGVSMARRTIAKYREQVGILPSSKRKRLSD